MTFIGTERKTGPRGGSIATLKARRRRTGSSGASSTWAGHLVTGSPLRKRAPARVRASCASAEAGSRGRVAGGDVLQPRVLLEDVHERLLGGAGVAEHVGDTVGDQLIDEGVAAGQSGHGEGSFRQEDTIGAAVRRER